MLLFGKEFIIKHHHIKGLMGIQIFNILTAYNNNENKEEFHNNELKMLI